MKKIWNSLITAYRNSKTLRAIVLMAALGIVGTLIALTDSWLLKLFFLLVNLLFIFGPLIYWNVVRPPVNKTFRINKGNHRSTFRPGVFWRIKSMHGWAMFFDSAKYQSGNNIQLKEQINKLIGFSRGHHHHCSFRIGWRYSDVNGLFHLYAYSYTPNNFEPEKITRSQIFLGSVAALQQFKWDIKMTDYDHLTYRVVFYIDKTERGFVFLPKKGLKKKGYFLYPFFGGKEPAPKDIMINIDVTNIKTNLIS